MKNPLKKRERQNSSRTIGDRIASLNVKSIAMKLVFAGLLIGVVSGIFWYQNIFMDNERRFWSAVDNSLSTPSVVRTLESGGSGNLATQQNRIYFSPERISESKVTFSNRSATVNTTVVTEGLSTPDAQYSRYVTFDTTDKRQDGSTPTLNDVLGKWSGETFEGDEAEQARLNYVSELVSLALFGNLTTGSRADIVNELRSNDIYQVDYNNVLEDTLDGEAVLIFPVSVSVREYAQQLQRVFTLSGLGEFPSLNPENLREGSEVNAQFTIRKRDNTIVRVNSGANTELYGNYGVMKTIDLPNPEFTPDELEQRVQDEIQG